MEPQVVQVEPDDRNMRAHWRFTLFLPQDQDRNEWRDNFKTEIERYKERIGFCVWQMELCPQTDRIHMQGHLNVKPKQRFSTVKRMLGNSVHLAGFAPGTGGDLHKKNNVQYCQKAETRVEGPWVVGEIPKCFQGRRTDISAAVDDIKKGMSFKELAMNHSTVMIKYPKGMQVVHGYVAPERTEETMVIFCSGAPGTGKSAWARWRTKGLKGVYHKPDGPWWQRYTDEETVVYDEFSYEKDGKVIAPTVDFFLKFCGQDPLQVPTKGCMVNYVAKRMFCMGNHSLQRIYGARDQWSAIARRFHQEDRHVPSVEITFTSWHAKVLTILCDWKYTGVRYNPNAKTPWYIKRNGWEPEEFVKTMLQLKMIDEERYEPSAPCREMQATRDALELLAQGPQPEEPIQQGAVDDEFKEGDDGYVPATPETPPRRRQNARAMVAGQLYRKERRRVRSPPAGNLEDELNREKIRRETAKRRKREAQFLFQGLPGTDDEYDEFDDDEVSDVDGSASFAQYLNCSEELQGAQPLSDNEEGY